MKNKYVITVFVSTLFWSSPLSLGGSGCGEDESDQGAPRDVPAAESTPAPLAPSGDPAPEPRHEANGISFRDLTSATYEDELSDGIAASRATYPGGIAFAVISSPPVVSADQALAVQMANARRAAASRGQIIEDADAPGRPFSTGELEGRRVIYRTAGGVMHTEVFAFEGDGRTVTVFIEVPDPPDQFREILDALTASVRVARP